MYASKITLRKFRSFQNVEIKLGKYLTCISGQNGVGKSQILALIGNSGQIPKKIGQTLQGYQFRADWSEIVKGDPDHDELSSVRKAITIDYDELPNKNKLNSSRYPYLGLVNSLNFRTFWQNTKIPFKKGRSWKEKHKSEEAREHIDEFSRRSIKNEIAKIKTSDTDKLDFVKHTKELIGQKCSLEQLSAFLNAHPKFGKELIDTVTIAVPYRFRIVPEKQDNVRQKEAKLPWPTYYLGLSRLYPSGEAKSPEVDNITLSQKDNAYIKNAYNTIFSTSEKDFKLSAINLSESPRKHGLGLENNTFGPLGNSNGQDNLNQILAAMLSFKKLSDSLKDDFFGGALLIDELDASLHPAAQNKLLDFMSKQARKYGYQIIFTTHSLSMIEHFYHLKMYNSSRNSTDFMLSYLTNGRGYVESKENPSLEWIHNELLISYNYSSGSNQTIPIITEDDSASTFLKKVIQSEQLSLRVDFLNLSTGWQNLLNLIGKDFKYFGKWITILDADVSGDDIKKKLTTSLFRFQINGNKKSIDVQDVLQLPNLLPDFSGINDTNLTKSDYRPYIELELWIFLDSLDEEDSFYANPQLEAIAFYKRTLLNSGPFSGKYTSGTVEDKVKAWYKDNQPIVEIAWPYFIEENKSVIASFVQRLIAKYNSVASAYYSNLPLIH